jgi:hypothetical protein
MGSFCSFRIFFVDKEFKRCWLAAIQPLNQSPKILSVKIYVVIMLCTRPRLERRRFNTDLPTAGGNAISALQTSIPHFTSMSNLYCSPDLKSCQDQIECIPVLAYGVHCRQETWLSYMFLLFTRSYRHILHLQYMIYNLSAFFLSQLQQNVIPSITIFSVL